MLRSRRRIIIRIVIPIIILIALGVYSLFPHPTRDEDMLQAVASEAVALKRKHPAGARVELASDDWPPAIASLKPQSVTVSAKKVDIQIRHYFDGGWGYSFAPDKQDLGMLPECWSDLGHDLYWHGPC